MAQDHILKILISFTHKICKIICVFFSRQTQIKALFVVSSIIQNLCQEKQDVCSPKLYLVILNAGK